MKKYNKWLCYLYLLLPSIFFPLIKFGRENDIWFLLSHGKYILSHGFPHTEFLSMHKGLHFVMQQWLSSILFYIPYKLLGEVGVYIFVLLINILIIYFLFKLMLKLTKNNYYIASISTAFIDFLLELTFIVPRPGTISTLIFIILLYIMELYKENSKVIYYLILLSLLEINLHASMWPVLFILLLPYLVYYLSNKDKDKLFLLIKVVILMFLVGFINPYGIDAMKYSFNSYGVDTINKTIIEMHGFNLQDHETKSTSCFIICVSFITIFLYSINNKKIELYKILLFLGTFFMSLLNIRNASLLVITSLPFSLSTINMPKLKYYSKFSINILIVIITLLVLFIYSTVKYKMYSFDKDSKILKYLQTNKVNTPLYTGFNYGSYYEYYGYKCYIDGRAEVYLKKNNHVYDYFNEYYDQYYTNSNIGKFLDKYKFKYLVVEKNTRLYNYLINSKNYKLVVKDNRYLFKEVPHENK